MAYSNLKLGPLSKKPIVFLTCGFIAVTVLFTVLFSAREQEKHNEIQKEQLTQMQSLKANLSKASKLGVMSSQDEPFNLKGNKALAKKQQILKKVSAKTVEDEDFAKNYVLYQEKHALTDRAFKDDSKDRFSQRTVSFEDYDGPPVETKNENQNISAQKAGKKISTDSGTYEQALKAPSKVNLEFRHSSYSKGSDSSGESKSDAFSQPGQKTTDNSADDNSEDPNRDNTLESYDKLKRDSYLLNSEVENPQTPFTLMQGSVIHASLLSGINSELPGQITALISRDVHDSIRAKYLLIPRGSKLLGQYASGAAFGTQRLFIGFNRIIFPNGQSVNLGSMPGQSVSGYSGFDADVDNHYFKIIANSLLLSSISSTADHFEDTYNLSDGRQRTVSGFKAQGSANISQALARIIERNVNLSPTLTVEPGYAFTVAITKDIFFKSPYGASSYGHFKR